MSDQSVIAAGGIALVAANFWTGSQRPALTGLIFNGTTGTAATNAMLQIGGELALIFGMWIVGGQSSGHAMLAFLVGLWLLWSIHHFAAKTLPLPTAHTPTSKG